MQKLLLLIIMSVLILQIQLKPQGFLHRENKKIVDDVKAGKIAEKDVIKIALSLTLNDTSSPIYETAISTLKGAIYLQDEFNKNPNKKLLILIANDPNKWDQARSLDVTTEKLNKELIGRDLDAVVGHYASKLTYYTLKNTFRILGIFGRALTHGTFSTVQNASLRWTYRFRCTAC
jgi:hypothetical protein